MDFFAIYWPFGLSAFFLYVCFFSDIKNVIDKEEKITTTVAIPPISFSIPIPISAFYSKRISFLIAIFFLVIPITWDYSQFLPARYRLVVSFDNEDIEHALEDFSNSEIKKLKIKHEWQSAKDNYLKTLENKVVELSQLTQFKFSDCHSTGETFCPSRKIKGLQKYSVQSSYGHLTHVLSLPNLPSYKFETKFKLIHPVQINLSFSNIINNSLIIELPYQQIAYPELTKEIHACDIIAVTKISFLPLIAVGNTLYLIDNKDGYRIPIGFAQNTEI